MYNADAHRRDMLARCLLRIHRSSTSADIQRMNALYDWFKRNDRQDIITEAEALCDRWIREGRRSAR